MKKGCCFGCLAVVLLLVFAIVSGVYGVARWLDLATPAPRVDTVQHIANEPAVCVRINPNQPEVLRILEDAVGIQEATFFAAFFPHEAGFAILPDAERATNEIVLSLSLRRLAALVAHFADDPELWQDFPGRITSLAEEKDGLWVVRSEMTIPEETLANTARWWPEPPDGPMTLTEAHAIEMLIDNRAGGAFLALEPLLVPHETDEDEIVVMKAPFELEATRLPGLFRRVRSVWLAADLPERDVIRVVLDATCRDASAAESLLFFLFTARDALYRDLIEQGIVLESEFDVDGAAIHGEFTARGYRNLIVHALEENYN